MYIEHKTPYTSKDLLNVPTLNPSSFNKSLKNIPIPEPESPLDRGIYEQLNQVFTQQDLERKIILEGRDILEESSENLTDEEVYNLVTTVKFLIDTWLEEFERSIFDGKTFNELFHINPT